MSTIEKLIKRLANKPKDFTFDEAKTLLTHYGFELYNKGKTSGSGTLFVKSDNEFYLHKPHPQNALKHYQVNDLIECLRREGKI